MTRRQKKAKSAPPCGGLELCGQAMSLVRQAPASHMACYLIGTLPFVLGLLYFWMDMSAGALAERRCLSTALVLAALFVWMKCWHTVFCVGLHTHLAGLRPSRWTLKRTLRMIATQMTVQAHGIWLLLLSLPALFFFPRVYAFFHHVSLVGDGRSTQLREDLKRAGRQAGIWPSQNALFVWLLSPWILALMLTIGFGVSRLIMSSIPEYHYLYGVIWFFLALVMITNILIVLTPFTTIVAGNIGIAAALIPMLLHAWFGIQTPFSQSMSTLFNTTFLMTIYSLSYIALDPFVKAGYVIRFYHGEAQTTGQDLLTELKEKAWLEDLRTGSTAS